MGHFMTAFATASIATTCALTLPATETELTWTPEAHTETKFISDVQLSPDNTSVLFVVTESDITKKKGTQLSRIYRGSGKEAATPFSAPHVSSMQPRWSPNGEWIAFLSTRSGIKNLYLLHLTGGEAIALTDSKKDVQTFCWSPDGQKIALVMSDELEAKPEKKTSLAYVYDQMTSINRLWVVDVFADEPTPKALTSNAYCVRGCGDFGTINTEFDWSPDSQKITFAYSPTTGYDHLHLDSSLATVDVETRETTPWEKQALFEAVPRYSPDGRSIAYVSSNSSERYAIDRRIAICSSNGEGHHRLLAPTFNEGAFIAGPNLLGWNREGSHVLFFEPKETKFHLMQLPIDGGPAQEVDTGKTFFKAPTLSQDRTMLGFVAQTCSAPPEAWIAKLDNFAPLQVSTLNQPLLSYPSTDTEVISWASKDGINIQGLLTYPVDYDPTQQYPLLLVIHGGPMGFFDETFLGTPSVYPLAAFAQAGFMVFRPNPRGSTGYGKHFRSANYNDWGGSDYLDIMTGVDALIDRGIVDAERLGVMGWSYGGYMTAWIITQTSRFKAASMGAGLSNLVSMAGTTDLYRFFTDYLGSFPDNRALYESRSPVNYVASVTTPCLIQHGTEDKRVPVSQSYEFYHALNRLGKETTLVLYPGMEHRLFDPKMELDAMERNLAWFQKHLMVSE